jgi:hypothetical protein
MVASKSVSPSRKSLKTKAAGKTTDKNKNKSTKTKTKVAKEAKDLYLPFDNPSWKKDSMENIKKCNHLTGFYEQFMCGFMVGMNSRAEAFRHAMAQRIKKEDSALRKLPTDQLAVRLTVMGQQENARLAEQFQKMRN